VEEIIKELLARNAELTAMVVELSRELAGVKTPVFPEAPEMERLFLTEEEEDQEYMREHDPLYGVDPAEVSQLLQLTGFDNTTIETG
jgi:hypothetical protein